MSVTYLYNNKVYRVNDNFIALVNDDYDGRRHNVRNVTKGAVERICLRAAFARTSTTTAVGLVGYIFSF